MAGTNIVTCLIIAAAVLATLVQAGIARETAAETSSSTNQAPHQTGALRRLLQQSAPLCTAAGQYQADPSTGCTHFWQCTGSGQGYYLQCGAGTAFNQACSCCDFSSNFVCTGANPGPATTPAPPVPTPPATPSPAASQGPSNWQSSTATFYNPAGGYGACGTVLQDSDMIVALGVQALSSSSYPYPACGKCIQVQCVGSTNSVAACKNSNVITVRVADRCSACASDGHLDLSQGAFEQIANTDAGVIKIQYQYVNSGC